MHIFQDRLIIPVYIMWTAPPATVWWTDAGRTPAHDTLHACSHLITLPPLPRLPPRYYKVFHATHPRPALLTLLRAAARRTVHAFNHWHLDPLRDAPRVRYRQFPLPPRCLRLMFLPLL